MIKPYYRTVLIYLIFALLWIYFSDALVSSLFHSAEMITRVQNLKGFAFVSCTALLLLFLIRADLNRIEQVNQKLQQSYDQTLKGWVQVMDIRHKETGEHSLRVTRMTVRLARLLGVEGDELTYIARGALMHDAGKVGIPDAILIKPGPLDHDEWAIMKEHPVIARDLMKDIEFLKPSINIPYCHHERWNGTGYPQGLAGKQIPLAARIFAIVDVWDALSEHRVYKQPWPEDQVLLYIREQAGIHFDPEIVEVFLDNYPEIKAAAMQPSIF
ncbi:HD-GYP domain-containing protein [Amphritea pacifica]|uniref:HD-GYP domain-containing protein n=1 Tax=Amphritea pacifica TaxID=2811233 RepID=UPI0019652D0B|nr:HD domain-containing phosphohydrolase [Amphritea pacifica]MBN1007123.1 HD domain-containing protein [Amphritea pacifica]